MSTVRGELVLHTDTTIIGDSGVDHDRKLEHHDSQSSHCTALAEWLFLSEDAFFGFIVVRVRACRSMLSILSSPESIHDHHMGRRVRTPDGYLVSVTPLSIIVTWNCAGSGFMN